MWNYAMGVVGWLASGVVILKPRCCVVAVAVAVVDVVVVADAIGTFKVDPRRRELFKGFLFIAFEVR